MGSKRKVFCRIEVYEGPEDLLRGPYARQITAAGATRFADGVKYGTAPILWEDIAAIHPKGIDSFIAMFDAVKPVELQERSDND